MTGLGSITRIELPSDLCLLHGWTVRPGHCSPWPDTPPHLVWLTQAAHQARATGCARQSQEGLGHVVAQVQVYPAAIQVGPVGF